MQVVLSRFGADAFAANHAIDSADGPMYRRHLASKSGAVTDWQVLGNGVAQHLATKPFDRGAHDRYCCKLTGGDRYYVQRRLHEHSYEEGSALAELARVEPRPLQQH